MDCAKFWAVIVDLSESLYPWVTFHMLSLNDKNRTRPRKALEIRIILRSGILLTSKGHRLVDSNPVANLYYIIFLKFCLLEWNLTLIGEFRKQNSDLQWNSYTHFSMAPIRVMCSYISPRYVSALAFGGFLLK